MAKVKNVIRYYKRYDINQLIIIGVNGWKPLYAGLIENWNKNKDMEEFEKEVDNMEVVSHESNCGCKVFIFANNIK